MSELNTSTSVLCMQLGEFVDQNDMSPVLVALHFALADADGSMLLRAATVAHLTVWVHGPQ